MGEALVVPESLQREMVACRVDKAGTAGVVGSLAPTCKQMLSQEQRVLQGIGQKVFPFCLAFLNRAKFVNY